MNNEEKILQILTQIQTDITELKQGQAKLENEVNNIRELQLTDSNKLEAVYNFSANLHERQVVTNQTLDAISN